jgi:predicted  nucleic acid-binding Zn-ribbon protein
LLIEYNRSMSAALGLLRLQQVDSRIDQLEAELERIRAELGNNDLAASAREAMESAGANQSLAENGRQQAEQQASAIRTKLKQAEGALYGGKVQNPKELQDLQAEVASLNKHLIGLDADELAWMEKLEAADAHCRATSVRLEEVLHKLGAEHTQLEQRRSELLRKKDSLLSERAATAEAVKPAWHQTYEGLRRTRRGVAVTAVEDGACAACGTALTPATQQNVRHAQDLIPCPSCGRILFAD